MIDQPTMSPPEAALVPGFDQVNRFVALDFEMTGHAMPSFQTLERATRFMKFPGVIIEIGAVAFHRDGASFRRGDIYQTFVNPDGPLNPQASAIHGIKSGQLKTAPRFKHIADTLLAFLADSPIVAHSYKNERDALDYELARAGRQGWRAEWRPHELFICTQQLFKRRFPDLRSSSLDAICDRLWIDRSDRFARHGALLDAELTAEALLKIVGVIPIQNL